MTDTKDDISVEKCIEELENYLDIDEEMAEAAIAHLRSLQQMEAEIAAKDKILDQHIAALRSVAWAITDKACGGVDDIVAEAKRVRAELEACRRDAERIDTIMDAFHRVRVWIDAYPLSVFPEPDFKRAHEVLKANGMTIDAISASNMRHVLTGIRSIIDSAISAGEDSTND